MTTSCLLSDDVCDCGLCAWDTCDTCDGPSDRLDDEGTSFCRRCWGKANDPEPPEWWLDRQIGLEPMSPSEEARYYQRMKGENYGW